MHECLNACVLLVSPWQKNYFSFGSSFSDTELMQYRSPVGLGPSGKTCPRCESQREHVTSIRLIPKVLSSNASILSSPAG